MNNVIWTFENCLKKQYRERVFCKCIYGVNTDNETEYHHTLLKKQGYRWYNTAKLWGIETEKLKKRMILEQIQYQRRHDDICKKEIYVYYIIRQNDKDNIDKDIEEMEQKKKTYSNIGTISYNIFNRMKKH